MGKRSSRAFAALDQALAAAANGDVHNVQPAAVSIAQPTEAGTLYTLDEIKQFNLRINGFSIGEIKQILRDGYLLKKEELSKDDLF